MKFQHLLIAIILLGWTGSSSAQEKVDPDKKFKRYDTWIWLYRQPYKLKGVLYEVKDSSIVVYSNYQEEGLEFFYSNIKTIRIRGGEKKGTGALIGVAMGLVAGVAIGLASDDDPPCPDDPTIGCISLSRKDKAVIYGFTLGAAGADLGTLVGSSKVKIPINGSFENYDGKRNRLKGYSVKVLSNSHPEEPTHLPRYGGRSY